MEYGASTMDPYLKPDMEKLERIQRNTVSFISGDYFVPTPGSVGNLLISTYIYLPPLHSSAMLRAGTPTVSKWSWCFMPSQPVRLYQGKLRADLTLFFFFFFVCGQSSWGTDTSNARCGLPPASEAQQTHQIQTPQTRQQVLWQIQPLPQLYTTVTNVSRKFWPATHQIRNSLLVLFLGQQFCSVQVYG